MITTVNDSTSSEPSAVDSEELGASYSVKLSIFEGPLDLLLHLIRQNEVEITEIPIARVCEQYVEYLGLMHELNLDVAGEYLVMAATLAWIKSRMLLPAEQMDEDGEEVDPRAELIARLLEYQRFKEVSTELGERPRLGRDVFAAPGIDLEPASESEREIEVGLFDLVEAYRRVLEAGRERDPLPHAIEAEEITVHERMIDVMNHLEHHAAIEFQTLLAEERGRALTRALIVATFLAVLELTRLAVIRLYQGIDAGGVPEGPLHLRRCLDPADASWRARVAELT
jgi:segregation and condensation protein A